MNNKIGLFVNFFENTWKVDLEKYARKIKAIGYDVMEFQAQALLEMSDEELASLKKVADEIGIELTYSLGLDPAYDISSPDDKVREGGIVYLTNIMKQIGKMGGKLLSGVSYAGWGVPAVVDRDARFKYSVESMKRLAKTAEELGITYGIEAVNRFEGVLVNTAKQAREYVKAVGSKSVGILLDTFHMNIEEASIREAILTAGDLLVGFHIGENNRTCPGRGHLDWDEIFGALKEIGYKGRIVAEPFVKAGDEVGRAIGVWTDLIDDPSVEARENEALYMLNFVKNY